MTLEPRLIGRHRELEELVKAVQPVFRGLFGGLVQIHGEPGMGKAPLLEALRKDSLADTRVQKPIWLSLRCGAGGRIAFFPFVSAMKEHFGVVPSLSQEENLTRLRQAMEQLAGRVEGVLPNAREELARAFPAMANLLGIPWEDPLMAVLEPRLRLTHTQEGLRVWLTTMALARPMIIHLDDAHLLDEESAGVLENTMRTSAQLPLVMVASYTEETGAEPEPLFPALTIPRVGIDLKPLSREQMAELAETHLGKPCPPKLFALLEHTTKGNPYHARQTLHFLIDQHNLKAESWEGEEEKPPPPIPSSLDDTLVARLERLPEDLREVVGTAAVIGQEFYLPVLAKMLPGLEQLEEKTRSLAELKIFREKHPAWLRFTNAFIHRAADRLVLGARRQELHRLAGLAIEELATGSSDHLARDLAHHFEQAHMTDKAKTYLKKAAVNAAKMYRHREATDFYRRLLEHLPGQGEEVRETCLALAESLRILSQWQDCLQYCDWAMRAHTTPSPHALRLKSEIYRSMGRWDEAADMAHQALDHARQQQDLYNEAESISLLALIQWHRNDLEGAQASLELGLALRHSMEDTQGEGKVQINLGILAWQRGDLKQSKEHLEAGHEAFREVHDLLGQAKALGNLGLVAMSQGDLDNSRDYHTRAHTLFEKIGDRREQGASLNNLGMVEQRANRMAEARDLFQRSYEIRKTVGDRLGEAVSWGNLGEVLLSLGEPEEALTHLDGAQSILEDLGYHDPEFLIIRISALTHMNRLEEAKQALDYARARAWDHGGPDHRFRLEMVAGEYHQHQGSTDMAEAAYQTAKELAARTSDPSNAQEAEDALKALA